MIGIYYESDQVVVEDQELQDFLKDVYVYGMRGRKASGRSCHICSLGTSDFTRATLPHGICLST